MSKIPFDEIAPKYDFLNHFLSFGIDRSWRRRLVGMVKESGAEKILDVACGTGDVTRALKDKGLEVKGVDLSEKMLEIAKEKTAGEIEFLKANAESLPFEDNVFDAVTVAFGVRNFVNRGKCLREMRRVLREDGVVAVLEFSMPEKGLWLALYKCYFLNVLPFIGKVVSRNKFAYRYLPESAMAFPKNEVFCRELAEAGYKNVKVVSLTGGVANIFIGEK